ncbi:MAG: DUF1415 family protein [Polyangiales bacterium]|nr:DUF1415 family protein [Myxococcales bacterium]
MNLAADLEHEAIRLYARYEVEIVEAFTLCPWAERARREGHTRQLVLAGPPEPEAALAAIDVLAADTAVEVGFLVYPTCTLSRVAFERFVSGLRSSDQQRGAAFAAAAFHPDAHADLADPYRLVPFIRRTPDPTVQLIRRSALEAVRRPGDGGTGYVDPASITDLVAFFQNPPKRPLHERVAQANLEQVERVGVPTLEAVLADIAQDRERAYAALLGAAHPAVRPPWR